MTWSSGHMAHWPYEPIELPSMSRLVIKYLYYLGYSRKKQQTLSRAGWKTRETFSIERKGSWNLLNGSCLYKSFHAFKFPPVSFRYILTYLQDHSNFIFCKILSSEHPHFLSNFTKFSSKLKDLLIPSCLILCGSSKNHSQFLHL